MATADAIDDPRELAELARRKASRRRQLAAILAVTSLVVGYVAWKAGAHLIASTWLQANRFRITWGADAENWRRGGVTTVRATSGFSPFEREMTRADMRFLPWLHRVEELDLSAVTGLVDADLPWLDRMGDLKALDLDQSRSRSWGADQQGRLTDATLARVGRLSRLRSLGLGGQDVGDAGLAHLRGLEALETLDLKRTAVTDAGLEHLKQLPRLKSVDLLDTRVTDRGVREFQAARPGVVVEANPPPGPTSSKAPAQP